MEDGKATVIQCDAEVYSSSSSSLGNENSKKIHVKTDYDEKTRHEEKIRHEDCNLRNEISDSRDIEAQTKVNGELENVEKAEEDVSNVQAGVSNDTTDTFNKMVNTKSLVNRKRKLIDSDEKNSSDDESEADKEVTNQEIPAVEFKGFKKRILAQTEKLKTRESQDIIDIESTENESDSKGTKSKLKKSNLVKTKLKLSNPEKNQSEAQLTEYAQYLGLQPTVKFKCARCGDKGFQSMGTLQCHQKICGKSGTTSNSQQPSLSIDTNPSTNFRITRKVYLCSACGTYYENWNLFLHMREMHKRYICLFCLGMFSAVEKLAEHLSLKHNISESNYTSSDDFHAVYKGTVYLMCCTCEQMFTERDNFFEHQCKEPLRLDLHHKCTLCGVKGGHFHTCPNNNVHTTTMTTQALGVQTPFVSQNSSIQSVTVTKYLLPIPKNSSVKWSPVKSPTSTGDSNKGVFSTSDFDDDYDISDAASFCHVDIGDEGIEKSDVSSRTEDEKLTKEIKNSDLVEASNCEQQLLDKCVANNDSEQGKLDINDSVTKFTNEEILDTDDKEKTAKKGRLGTEDNIEKPAEKLILETNENTEKIVDVGTLDSDASHEPGEVQTSNTVDNMDEPVENETFDTVDILKKLCEKDSSDSTRNLENLTSEVNIEESKEKNKEKLKLQNTDSEVNSDSETFKSEVVGINDAHETDKDTFNLCEEKTEEKDVYFKSTSELASEASCASVEEHADNNLQDNADKHVMKEHSEKNSENCSVLDGTHDTSTPQNSENIVSIPSSGLNSDEHKTEQSIESIDDTLGNFDDGNIISMQKNNIEESKHEELEEAEDIDNICNRKDSKNNTYSPKIPSSGDHEIINESDSKTVSSDSIDAIFQTDNSEKNLNDVENSCREENSNLQSNCMNDGPTLSDDEGSEDNLRREITDNEPDSELRENELNDLESSTYKKRDKEVDDGIQLASEDVPAMALTLEGKLNEVSTKAVVKECVRTSCTTCVYCSHAVKIAVNGKQLALHLLAEHRYTPIKNETADDVISKLKQSLTDLEDMYFNTDSYDSTDKSYFSPYDHTYECFQCHFSTKIHKELYGHKRKMHQKTILLCVMCKSNFYSYSELLCHMCPGIYVSEDILFRCCICNLDRIPSAFRLMVHLRKTHHTCDICLEVAGDQQKLSTHMWKHKLHHLCYRCGIAYRNKPDITKHLFWKHGTESVLCKRCLQKKWPHVYHFCIPPTVFICEECNASFSKAVALKVHKRLHVGDTPYACTECGQTFVSKKLLKKHEDNHNQVLPESKTPYELDANVNEIKSVNAEQVNIVSGDEDYINLGKDIKDKLENKDSTEVLESKARKKRKKEKDKKAKTVVDVYDLPPLNLSSESDDSEEESRLNTVKSNIENANISETECVISESFKLEKLPVTESEESEQPVTIVDGVWDNFHSYKAQLEKKEAMESSDKSNIITSSVSNNLICSTVTPSVCSPNTISLNVIMADHDYCLQNIAQEQSDKPGNESLNKTDAENPAPREHSSSIDHDYCTFSIETQSIPSVLPETDKTETVVSLTNKKKQKSPKKKVKTTNSSSSSESSSDSDSSSCSCGTNCSCSSSSSNSSSSSSSDSDSSSSEGKRRASARKERRKERAKAKKKDDIPPQGGDIPQNEEEAVIDVPVEPVDTPIRESDLDTDESSTDEDFYDKHPQRHANQILAEKRNQLMLLATVAPVNNGTVSPTPVSEDIPQTPPNKHKLKSKKRRKSEQSKLTTDKCQPVTFQENQPSTSFPVSKSVISQISANSTFSTASPLHPVANPFVSDTTGSGSETESTRLSKRKRVRNKFYGYSSDEDEDKQTSKFKKVDSVPVPQLPTPGFSFQPSLQVHRPVITTKTDSLDKNSDSSGSEVENKKDGELETSSNSSSDSSSDSESEINTTNNVTEQTEKSDNLYCYCQCPYDEVSEMIACDGQDCTIEWFHFECVGIMVPPKGKWYCPDCRKRRDL